MHEAKIVLLEAAVRSAGAINRREAAQALGFQDAVDRVSIEMREKVDHHEGQVIERKAGRTPQGADNGPLFFCCFPGSLCGGLAPLADGLGGHAIAAGQNTRGLERTCLQASQPADSLNQHLTDLGVAAESQLGRCANEALRKGPVLRIRSEDEY